MQNEFRQCTRCVMDTTDPDIIFDNNGVCNHCHRHDFLIKQCVPQGEDAKIALDKKVAEIKLAGKGKEYDCIIGVSGGVDSSYVAYKVKELGLRPLAVHLDNGWDSELAVQNIEHILKKLNIDLYTHVIDWEEFRDLQLSFLKASTPDSEIPSDHAIVSLMFSMARKKKIPYLITGYNVTTETHLPMAWSQGHWDWRYIYSIQKQFGTVPLKTFPHKNLITHYWDNFSVKRFDILNYINYSKKDVMVVLQNELGWKYYGGKHYESIYTRFYQGYLLPKKFGYDKRKNHLSSLICSGEISREEALHELQNETYPVEMQMSDKEYVIKKLGISDKEFDEIMDLPKKSYWDYPSYGNLRKAPIIKIIEKMARLFMKEKYS